MPNDMKTFNGRFKFEIGYGFITMLDSAARNEDEPEWVPRAVFTADQLLNALVKAGRIVFVDAPKPAEAPRVDD